MEKKTKEPIVNEADILYKADGRTSFFGAKIPGSEYILTKDSLIAKTGIFLQKTQTIPLYRIAAKEVNTNLIGRIFHCGIINIITRGQEVPDIVIRVKNPEIWDKKISEAIKNERAKYQRQQYRGRKKGNFNRKYK